VTGSTNNIGRAIADVIAEKGFHVIVTSRNEEEAKAIAESFTKRGSCYRLDFSQAGGP
jgi:short-subunit dehydrogenase